MIHIVFQAADIKVLQEAIALDDTLQGDIIEIRDDFAVGPIKDLFSEEGIELRKQWWREVLATGDMEGKADDGTVDDNKTVAALIERLDENSDEIVWIWAAQNKHDVSGYYWLMSQLKEYQSRIYLLYLNNLPFFNEKGNIFYPDKLSAIPAKEFLKAKKLARPITLSEFEVDPDEWKKLADQDKYVRILEGGKKLVQYEVNFYDDELKKFITGDWQKANKIIQQFLSKAKHTTGDMFLLWRLKHLLQNSDELQAQGNLKGLKDFDVKRKATVAAE
jgi:hypothetical protein